MFADLDGDGIAELLRSSGNGLAIFKAKPARWVRSGSSTSRPS